MRLRDRRVQMTYPVRLTCQVSGHPEPEVTWYKNREELFQDGKKRENYLIYKIIEENGPFLLITCGIKEVISNEQFKAVFPRLQFHRILYHFRYLSHIGPSDSNSNRLIY